MTAPVDFSDPPDAAQAVPTSESAAMVPLELRRHLDAFGLTQVELAQLLGANARTVRRWLAGEGPGIPGAVANTVRAWHRLQRAGLPWRPQDAPLETGDVEAIAAHRYHALDLEAVLERVRAGGGPATPWDVDLDRQRATLQGMHLTFYVLANGGFVPLSYRRQDALVPDPVRDQTLLEDGMACIARALERQGRRATPSLRLGPSGVVGGATLVLWEQRPVPSLVVVLPLAVARAVLGPSATIRELRGIVDGNGAALSKLAQALVDEGAGAVNALGVRELRLDEALLRIAAPRMLGQGENGPRTSGQGGEGVGADVPGGATAVGRAT